MNNLLTLIIQYLVYFFTANLQDSSYLSTHSLSVQLHGMYIKRKEENCTTLSPQSSFKQYRWLWFLSLVQGLSLVENANSESSLWKKGDLEWVGYQWLAYDIGSSSIIPRKEHPESTSYCYNWYMWCLRPMRATASFQNSCTLRDNCCPNSASIHYCCLRGRKMKYLLFINAFPRLYWFNNIINDLRRHI